MGCKINPNLDLVFEKESAVSVEKLWKGWTHPQSLMKWFCPPPWKVTECRIDLKPGGEFFTLMQGPNGEKMENHGCYLEVIDNKKLVWTGMMTAGFRPASSGPMGFNFVAHLHFAKTKSGSHFKAILMHTSEEDRKKHEQMGFQDGWGIAYNQLAKLT